MSGDDPSISKPPVPIDPEAEELMKTFDPEIRELLVELFSDYEITPQTARFEFQRIAVGLVIVDDGRLVNQSARELIKVDKQNGGVWKTYFDRVRAIRKIRKSNGRLPLTREGYGLWLDARGITDPSERDHWIDVFTDHMAKRGQFRDAIADLEEQKLLHPARIDPGFARAYVDKHPWINSKDYFQRLVQKTLRWNATLLFFNYLRRHRQDLYPLMMWPVYVAQEGERRRVGLTGTVAPPEGRSLDDEIANVKVHARHLRRMAAERDETLAQLIADGFGPNSEEYRQVKNLFDVRLRRVLKDPDDR